MSKIIYFDGVCNLCNWSVKFILRHDKNGIFSFAPLQSAYARKHLSHPNGRYIKYDSVIYQEDKLILTKSDAVFQISRDIGGWWKVLLIFKILPKSWRDALYDFIATNRYRWFGKRNNCMVPTKSVAARFLS